ncbi:hypothetical protein [Chryseobacterium indologenes]|uniref:hypothetical protein n=1 Tax=Chryseobacterium indologenes TaxID=253 RepID=UPI001625678A|nr:hypothetical protein [Chryseobacterium indologenes]
MKEILNSIVELFTDFSFEFEGTNEKKVLRVSLKGNSIEPEQIEKLSKIHPFRIVVVSASNIFGGTILKLVFELSNEDTFNTNISTDPEQFLKDFVKYLNDYAIADIQGKHINSFLGYRKIRNAKCS